MAERGFRAITPDEMLSHFVDFHENAAAYNSYPGYQKGSTVFTPPPPPPDIVVILFESDGSFHNRGTPM